jgi:hypothetical protein
VHFYRIGSKQFPIVLVLAGSIFLIPALVQAQGFGGLVGLKKAKEVTLKRMLPATVNLNQKRIKIVAVAISKETPQELLTVLKTKLATSIQRDGRFIVDERNPETVLNFSVTNYYVEKRSYAPQGTIPGCTFYTGKIEASYQAVEVGTEAPVDSENLAFSITEEGARKSTGLGVGSLLKRSGGSSCGTSAKATDNEARDALVDGIVSQMAQRAAPFEETLTVPVPEGKLEPISALAVSQRWAKLLEDAQKADPFPKPDDDAYRLYLIGLANEALAYQDTKDAADLEKARGSDITSDKAKQSIAQEESDFNEAQSYLDKAAKAYKDALQAKPGEKEFREPDARMEEAVKLYSTINRHKEEYRQAVLKKQQERGQVSSNAAKGAGGASDANGVLGTASAFNQVISMCQDRISDIGGLIKDHPTELPFDKGLTLAQELQLKKECGDDSKGILDEIKKQVGGRTPPAPAKSVPAAATKK